VCRSNPSEVMSRYSTSAQYFGAAHLSILFLRPGIFESGDFASVESITDRQESRGRLDSVSVKPAAAHFKSCSLPLRLTAEPRASRSCSRSATPSVDHVY